jgi:hypothetical protein
VSATGIFKKEYGWSDNSEQILPVPEKRKQQVGQQHRRCKMSAMLAILCYHLQKINSELTKK